MGRKKGGTRGGNHLKGWMLAALNVRGALVPNISGSIGQRPRAATKAPRGNGRVWPSAALSILVSSLRCAQPVNRWWSPIERDLSIKCVQSAVSESETTRAARSRECTTSIQCGGAHARDSSIARGTRPSAPEIRPRIGAVVTPKILTLGNFFEPDLLKK